MYIWIINQLYLYINHIEYEVLLNLILILLFKFNLSNNNIFKYFKFKNFYYMH